MGLTEVATLILDVDDNGVWDDMEKKAARAAKKAEREMVKAGKAALGAWKEFYGFLESGSPLVQRLSRQFEEVKNKVAAATAESVGFRQSLDDASRVLDAMGGSESTIRTIGNSLGGLANPAVTARKAVEDLERALMGLPTSIDTNIRVNILTAQGVAGAVQGVVQGSFTDISRSIGASQLGVIRAVQAQEGSFRNLALGQAVQQMAAQNEARRTQEILRGGRGGGGGGGREREDPFDEQERQRVARGRAELEQREADIHEVSERIRNYQRVTAEAQAEEERAQVEERIAIREREAQAQQANVEYQRELAEEEHKINLARIGRMEALSGAIANAASDWANALGAGAAARLVIVGIEETVLAAAAWAKVANPFGGQAFVPEAIAHTSAAALAFARAAGLGGGGGGGGAGAALPARAGGGGGFAQPRSSSDSGRGPEKIENTYVIKWSGDLVPTDRDIRRFSRHVRQGEDRGLYD